LEALEAVEAKCFPKAEAATAEEFADRVKHYGNHFWLMFDGDQLVDSTGDPAQEKSLYTDTPIVHQFLKELNRESFGQDAGSITVGEMSSTTIANSIEYSSSGEHELSMVFNFHHLKVDYKDGEKWSKMPFDFMKLKELFTDWQEKWTKSAAGMLSFGTTTTSHGLCPVLATPASTGKSRRRCWPRRPT
jgi:hypothetical protein